MTYRKLFRAGDDGLSLLAILLQKLAQVFHLVVENVEVHLMSRIHGQTDIHAIHTVHATSIGLLVDLMLRDRGGSLTRQRSKIAGAG